MLSSTALEQALGGFIEVPKDWIRPTTLRPLYFDDPGVVWLEHHGATHGFEPDAPPYSFLEFIFEKGNAFAEKWTTEVMPEAILVCSHPGEARYADSVRRTFEFMQNGTRIIAQPALWWAPERIYGAPDFLVHTSWLAERFPHWHPAPPVDDEDHYLIVDVKFTSKLDEPTKRRDLACYGAQVRFYSYMLGHLQRRMPACAFLVTRDRVADLLAGGEAAKPITVPVGSALGVPLDSDLTATRDHYCRIRDAGAGMTPWTHAEAAINLQEDNERWTTAKQVIATERTPGRDPALLYQVGGAVKANLAAFGFRSLDDLLRQDPQKLPLEKCQGIGAKRATQMRAVLGATRAGSPLHPPSAAVPKPRRYELFVDFEYLSNLNVDFDTQWPSCEGKEMVFMVGIGDLTGGEWRFRTFMAKSETPEAERTMFGEAITYLNDVTGDRLTDPDVTALYHWSSAENWQARRSAERLGLPADHVLRALPWVDLQKSFHDGPGAMPGALGFGLKDITLAMNMVAPAYAVNWPEELAEGLTAMVMGWRLYQAPSSLEAPEAPILKRYLEADCLALTKVLSWLRNC